MKGEYVDETQHNTQITSKLHQINKFYHNHNQTNNNFTVITSDSPDHHITSDGATIEVIRRPRGRPPGSKNKPKPPPPPPLLLSPTSDISQMSPYILQVHPGADILDSITQFCRKRNTGLSILTGTGAVTNVTLRQISSTTPSPTVTFHGRFDILSISATILNSSSQPFTNGLTISIAGPQGQIVGGNVVGSLRAAGTVYIVAASFNNPSFERLPLEEDNRNSESDVRSPSAVSGGGESMPAVESCGVSMYNSHLPSSDVIWAPIPRQPLQHPPY